MSCVSVTLGMPKSAVVSVITPSQGCVEVNAMPSGWCESYVKHYDATITCKKMGNMTLDLALVCSVGTSNYLVVLPRETMYLWVISDSIDYNVRSNTDWIIH